MMEIGLSVNDTMTNRKIWFITGASRGMGVDFVKAALAAGHAVVGTGRDPDAMAKAVGDLDDLRVVKLDVTSRRRCHRPRRAEGRRSQSADLRLPRTVHVALSRLARARQKPEVVRDARERPVRRLHFSPWKAVCS